MNHTIIAGWEFVTWVVVIGGILLFAGLNWADKRAEQRRDTYERNE